MVETEGRNILEFLAPRELAAFDAAVSDFNNPRSLLFLAEMFVGVQEITTDDFSFLSNALLNAANLAVEAVNKVRDATRTGRGENPQAIDNTLFTLRQAVKEALSELENDVLVTVQNPTNPARPGSQVRIPVAQLNLHRYFENRVRLGMELRRAAPQPAVLKEDFQTVANSDAARLVPSLWADVVALAAANPDLEIIEPSPPSAVTLTPEQIADINKLFEKRKSDPNLLNKEADWLDPDFLNQSINIVTDSATGPREDLPGVVKEQLSDLERVLKWVTETARVNPNIYNQLGLVALGAAGGAAATNAQEILEAVNSVLQLDRGTAVLEGDPIFEGWKHFVLSTRIAESHLDSFMHDIAAKLRDPNAPISPQDLEHIREARRNVEDMLPNVGMPIYDDPQNTGYNEALQQKKRDFLNEKKTQLTDLLALAEQRARTPEAVGSRETDENFRTMVAIYNQLRNRNLELPSFENLDALPPPRFVHELTAAIMREFADLFDKTTNSGSGPIPMPDSEVDLWEGHQFSVPGTTENKNLDFFFSNFPWNRLSPNLSPEERRDFVEMWKLRIVHIAQMHNTAVKFYKLLDGSRVKGDFPNRVVEMIQGMGNSGGLFPADMVPFYTTQFEPGSPLAELVGEEDISWRIPLYVNFFTHMIDHHANNYSPDDQDSVTKLNNQKDIFKRMIPIAYRPIKGDGSPLTDEELLNDKIVDVAWQVAGWTLYPMLRIFDYDDNALTSTMGRAVNIKNYGPKVVVGKLNTEARWRDTIIQQIETAVLPRKYFIHAYVELPPEIYAEAGPGANPISAADIQRVLDDAYARGIDVKAKDVEGATYLNPDNAATRPQYEAQLALWQNSHLTRGLKPEQLREFYKKVLIKAGGTAELVDQRYKLIRIKPEHSVMGLSNGLPIAIPRHYIEYSRRQGHPNRIALSDAQIVDSLIDPKYVDYQTMTVNHQTSWAKGVGELIKWYGFANLEDEKAIFTPIHNLTHFIQRRKRIVELPSELKAGLLRVFAIPFNVADATDRFMRSQVRISRLHNENLVRDMNFAAITKSGGRYAMANLTSVGPKEKDESLMKSGEVWLEIIRSEWAGDDEYSNFRELRNGTRRRGGDSELKKRMTTAVPPGVREAVDMMFQGSEAARGAENQMILESLIIAIGAYLDQYAYQTIEEGHTLPKMLSVDDAYELIHCNNSNVKPMDFAHRELFLQMCKEQLEAFGGDREFPNVRRIYGIEYVEQMMRDRGLIGTNEQYIVDMHYYQHEYPKLKDTADDHK